MEGQGTWGLGRGTKDRRQPAWNCSPVGVPAFKGAAARRSSGAGEGWGAGPSSRPPPSGLPLPTMMAGAPPLGTPGSSVPRWGVASGPPAAVSLARPTCLRPSSTLHLLSGPSMSEAGAKCPSSRASGGSCPDGAGTGMAPGQVEPRGQVSKSCGQLGLPPPALSRRGPPGPGVPSPEAGAAMCMPTPVLTLSWRGQRPASQASPALDLHPGLWGAVWPSPAQTPERQTHPNRLGCREAPASEAAGPWSLRGHLWPPRAPGLQLWFPRLHLHRRSVINVCGLPCQLAQGALAGSGLWVPGC